MNSTVSLGYACKYTPIELLEAFGAQPQLIDREVANFECAEACTHANMCTHAKALLEQASDYDNLVLTDCCDSMRRVGDVVRARGRHRFFAMLDLPHDNKGCAKEHFARELKALAQSYSTKTGITFDADVFLAALKRHRREHNSQDLTSIHEPFFAVVGARVSPLLLSQIQASLSLPVLNLTCSGNRVLAGPPSDLNIRNFDALMQWYADALLTMTPCMRMADVASRRSLTQHPALQGIIYNTVKFCDFYNFDYWTLQSETTVPVLKIESDYMPQPTGQLTTRLQAFSESVYHKSATSNPTTSLGTRSTTDAEAAPLRTNQENTSVAYVAGIDSGSTSTNMVVLDIAGHVVASAIVRTGAKAEKGAYEVFGLVKDMLGVEDDAFASIIATGYGRANIPFATSTITEITCHAKGAHYLNPDVRTIVDIGGQDSKVIVLDETGAVANFVMNDKCAAGTGRFLEAMARTLEIDLDAMSTKGLSWKRDLTISSMCTVFAESEVISLIADNHQESDIIHGLNKSIASRTASMVSRAKGKAPYMMTGGVARNAGVVKELENRLQADLFITEDPDLCGALGAALFAWEETAGFARA